MSRSPTRAKASAMPLGLQADRARDARATQAAVPVGHLGEVLLVVVLGVVELAELRDLGRDRAEAGLAQPLAEHRLRSLHGGRLLGRRRVDRRAVLGTGVVALAHALRRIVALPEQPQDLLVADLRG